MRISEFDWDDRNEEHIARHAVDPSEVEEVFRRSPLIQSGRKGTYLAWGQSAVGRYLLVVFLRRESGTARVITARDMSDREKKRLRRRSRS